MAICEVGDGDGVRKKPAGQKGKVQKHVAVCHSVTGRDQEAEATEFEGPKEAEIENEQMCAK